MSPEERRTLLKAFIAECKEKEGGSDADVDEMVARKAPSTKSAKCMHACVSELVGAIKDGKVSVEGTVEIASKAFAGDEKAVQTAKEIAMECSNISDPDRCEYAAKVSACARDSALKRDVFMEN